MADENNVTNGAQATGEAGDPGSSAAPEYNLADVIAAVGVDAILKDPTVNAEVMSRRDRSVTQALQTARTKWNAEAQKKADAAADEATRLAAMSEAERERYQFQKDKEAFEKQKAEFSRKSLVLETSRQMLDAGLPDLANYVTGKDAEETAANIASVTEILSAWKAAQLNEVMRGKAPKEMRAKKTYTREDLKHMSPAEINEAYEAGLLKGIK